MPFASSASATSLPSRPCRSAHSNPSIPSLVSHDSRHPTVSINRVSDPVSTSSTNQPSQTHRMDSALFDCFDVCGMSAMRDGGMQTVTTTTSVPSKLTTAMHAVSARLQSWLPRRLHEPTGPWALMLDMLLSLFVAQGACRSAIDALPLEVVGGCRGDLESEGVVVPVAEGDKCAICLGCYEEGDAVRHLECNHAFHAECVDVWLERKSLCPICKTHSC